MKFARVVFTGAGLWGLLILIPAYFAFDVIGREYPPPITHPDYYFGFLAITVAWQIAFLVIGRDPLRFRPLMLPAVIEKASYVVTLAALYARGRIALGQTAPGVPDLVLCVLFVAAFARTRGGAMEERHLQPREEG